MANLYPPTASVNGINQGLFPFHVVQQFFKEWVQVTPLWNFMGNEMTRPIVRHQMRAGEGWQYRVGKLNALDYTKPVLNFDQVSGQGQYQSVDEDEVNCNGISFPVTLKGRQLVSLGTPIDLPSAVRPQLIEVSQRCLNRNLFDAAMTGAYAVATQKPSYDRAVLAGVNPTRTTYNGYVGLTTALNSLAGGTPYTQNGLSANHLLALKQYAVQGGNLNGAVAVNGQATEDPIRPAFIKSRGGWPMNDYIFLTSTQAIQTLYDDPKFFQSTAARGTVIDSSDQPQTIYGSEYHGKFFGIHIYEVKDLSNYLITSQDGAKVASWGLFIGAAAWSLGWFEEPNIAFKDDQINRIQEFTTHEIRGQKALMFAAKQALSITAGNTTVEQGIIHSFTRVS